MVLYRPKEAQKYEYYAEEQPEVYWVHFTGGNVTNLIRSYGIRNDQKVFYCGSGLEYQTLFRAMISELQMCRDSYPEMLEMYLRQIFIRNFKLYTGFTPMQYILSKRIYNAEALLQNTQYNITEIAQIVGYDNPLYFSRIFKKLKGISPSEYRKHI